MATHDRATYIAESWFGPAFGEAARGRLHELAHRYDALPRTTLLREGDITPALSIVAAGRVALTERVAGRGSITLLTVEAGDVFGWSALVKPYTAMATVTSLEPVEIVAFDGPALRAAMAEDASLSAAVWAKVSQALSKRLMATRHQLLDLYGSGWAEPVHEPW
jgi:CRP-like cAMP-binding protein